MDGTKRGRITVLFILLLGFLAGIAAPELFRMGTGDYAGLASRYGFQTYENSGVSARDILPYILSIRLKTLLFLWMSSFTAVGLWFHLAYALWLAASAGLLISLFALRDGYDGVVLFACCILPQWILYAAMWKREGNLLSGRIRQRLRGNTGGVGAPLHMELLELARMAGLCVLGCAVEAYLGRWTLKLFLKMFT